MFTAQRIQVITKLQFHDPTYFVHDLTYVGNLYNKYTATQKVA